MSRKREPLTHVRRAKTHRAVCGRLISQIILAIPQRDATCGSCLRHQDKVPSKAEGKG